MRSQKNMAALQLFAPLATDYGLWSRVLSLGQDPRWRRKMVEGLELRPGTRVLDVAAGTGEVTRLLQQQGCEVVSLDQSPEMLDKAVQQGAVAIIAGAEELPFPDNSFDALTFTYLLRYVEEPRACLRELARVLRNDGKIGMVEFGRPQGIIGPVWKFYTQVCLPLAGKYAGSGWSDVGSFLGPNIEEFWQRFNARSLTTLWEDAGFGQVETTVMSLGGGFIMTGRKE